MKKPKRLFKNYVRPVKGPKSLGNIKTVTKTDGSGKEYIVREWDGKLIPITGYKK